VNFKSMSSTPAVSASSGSLGHGKIAASLPMGAPQIVAVGMPTAISLGLSKVVVHPTEHDGDEHKSDDFRGEVFHIESIGDRWWSLDQSEPARSTRSAALPPTTGTVSPPCDLMAPSAHQPAVRPPSMLKMAPVTWRASSDRR